MLYSHSQENEKLNLFTIFLNRAAAGDTGCAPIVNNVLLETHKYAVGEKTLYTVNRDQLHIILLLAGLAKSYFEKLVDNPDKYDRKTYSAVLKIMAQKQHAAAE